jgi:hypothetical protein
MGYCALASCAHRHPTKRACLIGRRRKSGCSCPDYRAKPPRVASKCRVASCVHFYHEGRQWLGRCRLGLKFRGKTGECSHYRPKAWTPRRRKVGTCSLSSCIFWYRSETGRYRCSLGLSRRSGQECPRYARKRFKSHHR